RAIGLRDHDARRARGICDFLQQQSSQRSGHVRFRRCNRRRDGGDAWRAALEKEKVKRMEIVTIFGSSRPVAGDAHYAEALALGAALAAKGLAVCSGGYGGVMEAVSRGAKESGGRTLAVTAEFFKARANRWVEEEIRVRTWQERLFELVERGHGYVVPRRDGNAGGACGGLGNAEQGRHEAKAAGGAGRFLATNHRARARSGTGSRVALGRARRTAGASGELTLGGSGLSRRAFSDARSARERF